MIMQAGGLYQGHCLGKESFDKKQLTNPHSIRFHNKHGVTNFVDRLQGLIKVDQDFACEDFILKRKDGLFAYQLVVVLDDIEQQITDIVRGSDLLEVTTRQLTLFNYFDAPTIGYLHLPLAINSHGLKLSKQNHAMALNMQNPKGQLIAALAFLGQNVNEQYQDLSIDELLIKAADDWQISKIPLAVPPLAEINTN